MKRYDSIKWSIYPYLFVLICMSISGIIRFLTYRKSKR